MRTLRETIGAAQRRAASKCEYALKKNSSPRQGSAKVGDIRISSVPPICNSAESGY
jgi:hypothetical protein